MIYESLLESLEVYRTPDLDVYLGVIASMFSQLELYTGIGDPGQSEDEDWSDLLDVDYCPPEALPYLAQFIGERIPEGFDEQAARQWIRDTPNQLRGTVNAIYSTAKRNLTEPALATLIERSDGTAGDHPDHIYLITYTDQTPDLDKLLADLEQVVPADIVLHHVLQSAMSWQQLRLGPNGASWTAVRTNYPSWGHVAADRTSGIIG